MSQQTNFRKSSGGVEFLENNHPDCQCLATFPDICIVRKQIYQLNSDLDSLTKHLQLIPAMKYKTNNGSDNFMKSLEPNFNYI